MANPNVTFLGDVADDFDMQVERSQAMLDAWVEESGYSTGTMAAASSLIAFMRIGQSFVDTLKLGNGVASGTLKGVAIDGLRLLNVTGVGGAVFSRLSRILVVTQTGGNLCSWISTVNAIRRSGQRFFVTLADLAGQAGVDLRAVNAAGGTAIADFMKLQQALGKMGIPSITLRSSPALGEIGSILRSYPKSVLVFAVKYVSRGNPAGHQLIATFSKSAGLVIKDTTGAVYRSIDALQKAYPLAQMFRDYSFVIPNSAMMNAAGSAQTAGGLASVILELLPLEIKPAKPAESRPFMRNKPWEY